MNNIKPQNDNSGNSEVKCIGYKSKKNICNNIARFPKVVPYCSNCAGASFEDQVARLFRVQGYNVQQNLSLSGSQNDIYAVLEFGFVTTGILIECKWKFKDIGKVDSEDVRKFSGTYELFNKDRVYGIAQHAYLVTNAGFAPEAIEMAEKLGITLFTYQDLISKLIKFDSYLDLLIKQYEESPLAGHYIELKTNTGEFITRQVIRKLRSSNAVVLLGDYGTGKTSFCLRLCHSLAGAIRAGKPGPLPIYIQLKEYTKAVNMDTLITNLLVNNCRIHNASIHTFKELLDSIEVILVFDGFDEIARRVDYAVKFKVFDEICRYATETTKIIVTCRPNFFNQRSEFDRIFKSSPLHFEPTSVNISFEEVEIGELDVKQIKKYIKSFEKELSKNGLNYIEFIRTLDSIHDLWDLAKRPVLLNVMLETIPRMEKNSTYEKINAANLYNRYTGFWLDREDRKGKTLIKSSEKINFIEQLAKKMFITNSLTINHRDLPDEVKNYFNVSDPENIEHYSHDIRSCSFLHLDDTGDYKFIHKSFMEYFVAKQIVSELKRIRTASKSIKSKTINSLLGECLLTLEIGLFIRDFIDNNELTENDIKALSIGDLDGVNRVAMKNLLSICIKTNQDTNALLAKVKDLEGADLSFINLNNIKLTAVNLNGAILYNANIHGVKFLDCQMINTVFRKSTMRDCTFFDCKCDTSDFSNSTLSNCTFNQSILAYSKVNDTTFENCNFNRSDITEILSNSRTQLIRCKNVETTIGTPYDTKWQSG